MEPVRRESLEVPKPNLPLQGGFYLLLTAAGSSSRFGKAKKELVIIEGKTVLQRALEPFLAIPDLLGVLITYPQAMLEDFRGAFDSRVKEKLEMLPCGLRFLPGGASRQASVALGLDGLLAEARAASLDLTTLLVLIHDAARPWIDASTIHSVLETTRRTGACLPLSELPDTPKLVNPSGIVTAHPERSGIMAAQTPQGFALLPLAAAHRRAAEESWTCTDDTALWARYIGTVTYVKGSRDNRKITYAEDLGMALPLDSTLRIGEGWDIHPLVAGRRLLLGGHHLPYDKGESGHSDGDVLWHAIIDALLGAAALGDIGTYFPPSDPAWKDADSSVLARNVAEKIRREGWKIINLDCTVILEKPGVKPHKEAIVKSIAASLDIGTERVSVKAKTMEGFGAVGSGDAIEARAVVLLSRP
ncbi:MAG: 2-C-methyl-D-erythritol 2,4-cyclodiphosphate synthase [Spirochaetia bacterium]|jgi:2-C-methyl-D-erythritol 4-phosphate cytidylyltransferase/2-C-methyl-D-erythritol 2,4-cyclodiphosphate synthase|nr:2-C-methyl-D-erythritol 2,4-cyclodiphosphate synthase [Spirochaetia bacterium]